MKSKITSEHLKYAAGFIIVLSAALIMMPGLLNLLQGMGRIALWIVLALAIAIILGRISALVITRFSRNTDKQQDSGKSSF